VVVGHKMRCTTYSEPTCGLLHGDTMRETSSVQWRVRLWLTDCVLSHDFDNSFSSLISIKPRVCTVILNGNSSTPPAAQNISFDAGRMRTMQQSSQSQRARHSMHISNSCATRQQNVLISTAKNGAQRMSQYILNELFIE